MDIEENIFKRYSPDFNKLIKYGFKKNQGVYHIEKLFKDNLFKANININTEGKVFSVVYDIENDDEFLPLRVESNKGAFVGEIRTLYQELLEDIRDKCFIKKYFIYPQTNRIVNLVIEKYGDKPEFLWEKFSGTGVFRNSKTNKWYLVILDVDRSKIQKGKKGLVEVADIKLAPQNIEKLTKEEYFYGAYHMNKKHWISIILDNSVDDNRIIELIEESYSFTNKRKV